MDRMSEGHVLAAETRDTTSSRASASPDLVTAKILVVDDDRRNLFAVEEMLRAPGTEIVLATSGEDALRRVLSNDFAVILLDVQMPGLDGYEAATMIRSRPRSSRVPIIFLTAFNKDDLHVFRGYTAGAVDYVFKPIEPLVLRSKVDVFVDLYRKTEEIRRQGAEERRLLIENLRVRGEKLKAEQALRRAQERQEAILRSLPVVVTSRGIEPPFPALFVSDNVERLTGFPAERFTGDPEFGASRIHPEDMERVFQALSAAKTAGSYACEYRWRCADDGYRIFLDQGVLAPGEGASREVFGTMFDVTERRQLEQQLTHASKLEAVGRLTGGIAHDFNNMLSVVIGNLDLLQKAVEHDKKAARRVRFAMDGAQRCADLTNRLLAFSRRQPLQASVIDLREIMPTTMELLRRTLGERIDIHLDIAEGVWPIHVDRSQLESALINLCVNARDAMPEGGRLTIEVRNRPLQDQNSQPEAIDGDCVVISVIDTGVGIPPEVIDRVFEPFFTTKESGKGTGLGLSMVYGFIQQSGGHVEIDSAPGEGTTIRIFLPRSEAEKTGKTAKGEEATPILGNGETVLVVEDDASVRQVTVSTLEALGFSVMEASSGDEAAAMLRNSSDVRVVLSDVKMPGMTGVELAQLIKEQWPSIRVLLTSGYVDADERSSEFDFIHKPFRASDLAGKLQTMLERSAEGERRLEAVA
jgi:signal transduction histidine kinase